MVWISVDGLEGSGKSTLARCLKKRFNGSRLLPEFSSGFAGKALRSAVKHRPHLISSSPVAQSLFFLAEYREKIECLGAEVKSQGQVVISDRGLLSKIVYQTVVLEPAIGPDKTNALLGACLDGLPTPDLIVCLRVDVDVALDRIRRRGGRRSQTQIQFIRRATIAFETLGKEYSACFFDTTTTSASLLCDCVLAYVLDRFPMLSTRVPFSG